MSAQAIVSVGSNIDPLTNVERARRIVAEEQRLAGEASLRWTAPVGVAYQPDFLNGAWLVETDLEREAFAVYLKRVEERLGRDRGGPRFGPRTIDLDLVVWNGRVVHHDYYDAAHTREPVDEIVAVYGLELAAAGETVRT